MQKSLDRWVKSLDTDQYELVEALPLRRDLVTLLTYLRDQKVKGTQSRGNLPRKAIWEVTAQFVTPPVLEEAFGDHIYKVQKEDDVIPLNFLHVLASVGGLLTGGPGRLIQVTGLGERFFRVIPPVQVWFMLVTWWGEVDWLFAFPFAGMGEHLPRGFEKKVLRSLLALPVGQPVVYIPFADKLIHDTRLKWHAPGSTQAQDILRMSIESMVIRILADFSILLPEYNEKNPHLNELVSFQVTEIGRGLLDAIPKAEL